MKLTPGQVYANDLEVVAQLGSGAFSQVYEVRSPRYPHRVALKLSHEPVTEDEVAQRALREVTIQRSLTCPGVAKIYEHGLRPDGHFYVVMDLIDGESLDRHWSFGRPMPWRQAVDIGLQICEALDLLHAEEIVHRDIKPGNVIIERRTERAFLVDFGLARSWTEGELHGITATLGHKLVGTPHYAQPEQVEGTPLSPAADVYSLGMILYELMTGYTHLDAEDDYLTLKEAWRETPIRWINAHVRAKTVPPTTHLPQLPPQIEAALMKALEKDARDRPQRARDFAAMLEL